MQFQTNTVRQGINKAYLKVHVKRGDLDTFKTQANAYLNQVDEAGGESEEHLKGYLKDFLANSFYQQEKRLVNTSDRIDLAIYSGKAISLTAGLDEVKAVFIKRIVQPQVRPLYCCKTLLK
jgi:CRISPR/Cas system CMR-associated protein Cmr5 small subunit